MRIAGGQILGRSVKTPAAGHVRPTQDAVREAVFSMLANILPDCAFLDLFAGSGCVGIEAWSRGAARVVWIEQKPAVAAVLRRNVETLCGKEVGSILQTDAIAWLARSALGSESFDIIYVDPPYDEAPGFVRRVLDLLPASGRLAPGGFLVIEQRATAPAPEAPGWKLITQRRYGQTGILILRRLKEA
ncbi:MAG: 16S rRNA (guanine(966)-N(2))-methyltransferase RsmD [Kiritimatiellia bacterium]|jgi:16S rRNA (guanine966-N2)-methyltransferase